MILTAHKPVKGYFMPNHFHCTFIFTSFFFLLLLFLRKFFFFLHTVLLNTNDF